MTSTAAPITIAEFIRVLKITPGRVFAPVHGVHDTFYVQIVKSDLISQLGPVDSTARSPFSIEAVDGAIAEYNLIEQR